MTLQSAGICVSEYRFMHLLLFLSRPTIIYTENVCIYIRLFVVYRIILNNQSVLKFSYDDYTIV
jgi:hypothetical protein